VKNRTNEIVYGGLKVTSLYEAVEGRRISTPVRK
jgi:hypothetical protein